MKLLKVLYGLLRSALLFYKKLRNDLEDIGFEVNPHDPCVANKTINGSRMTVTWYVDDLKVSHKESTEVTKFVIALGGIYGDGLSVTRGNIHLYLGMDFYRSIKGDVKLSIIPYSKQNSDHFPEPITSTAQTPATDHLFQVWPDDEPKLLPEGQVKRSP